MGSQLTREKRRDISKTIVGIFRLKRRKKRLRSERMETLSRFLDLALLEDDFCKGEGGNEGDDNDDEVEGDERRLAAAVSVEGEEGEKEEEEVEGSSTSRSRCSLRTSECMFSNNKNNRNKMFSSIC